jgi:hypothetical protein
MDTLNEILMPAFIFTVTFCFLCCQVSGKTRTVHPEVESETLALATEPVAVEPVVAEPAGVEPVVAEAVAVEPVVAEAVAVEPVAPELYEQALNIINGLKIREARQLCKPLGIQQKRNGVELRKEMLVGNIKKKFKENPGLVIATLSEKLNIKFVTADSVKAA